MGDLIAEQPVSGVGITSGTKRGKENTTLAWSKFGIDPHTGFLPNNPLSRLPPEWEAWEAVLDSAMQQRLQLGALRGLSQVDRKNSEEWRSRVRDLPILPITELKKTDLLLYRAHHVLSFVLHFYVHSLPPEAPVKIPPPLTLPLLQVSAELQMPPTLVYADDILSNWIDSEPSANYSNLPAVETLRARTLFTGTTDEENFYVTPARIELRGVELLKLMQTIFSDAICLSTDAGAIQKITNSLTRFSTIISELRTLFLARHEKVNPDYYYKRIRPWLMGDSSETPEGKWVFEGIERDPTLRPPTERFGSSGAQCSLIQSLDIFLGVDNYADNSPNTSFIQRMRLYMPRRHRAFLEHLSGLGVTRPLREVVKTANDGALLEAYNGAVRALKVFRDAHMIIATLFVIGPARRLARADAEAAGGNGDNRSIGTENMKGTAGGDLARLLKGFRDRTAGAVMVSSSSS